MTREDGRIIKTANDLKMEKRRIWQSACQGKAAFETRAQAQAINLRRAKRGRRAAVYACKSCGKYHLGNR